MFGKSKTKLKTKTVETIDVNPYDDEPAEWKQYADPEHVRAWFMLDLITGGGDKPINSDGQNGFPFYFDEAHRGNRSAQYALGKMYLTGTLIQQNTFQAGLWFSQASDQDSPFACFELAKMMQFGIGFGKDPDAAAKLYEKSYQPLAVAETRNPNPATEMILSVIRENRLCPCAEADPVGSGQRPEEKIPEPVSTEAEQHAKTPTYVTEQPGTIRFPVEPVNAKQKAGSSRSGTLQEVPADYIVFADDNPYSENDTDEAVYAMAMSIQANGLLNPIILNQLSDTKYRIISGEKRYKALTKYLNWKTIPSLVHKRLSKNAEQLMLHTANLEVREYTPSEKLRFYIDTERLLQKMKESGEYAGSVQQGIAKLLGMSTRQVRRYKIIVENLSKSQLKQVEDGAISMDRAYQLAKKVPCDGSSASAPNSEDTTVKSGHMSAPDNMDNCAIVESVCVPEFKNKIKKSGHEFTPKFADITEKSGHVSAPESVDMTEKSGHVSAPESADMTGKSGHVSAPESADMIEKSGHVSAPESADMAGKSEHVSAPESADMTEKSGHVSAPKSADTVEKSGHMSAPESMDNNAVPERSLDHNFTGGEAEWASPYSDPQTYQDAVRILARLPTSPGKSCAVLDGDDIRIGEVYRIEIYNNALLISVLADQVRHPYPVSAIGKTLFVGSDPYQMAKEAKTGSL